VSKVRTGMTEGVGVLVTLDDDHRNQLSEMAKRLESAGLHVAETFPLGGVIAGEAAQGDLAKLRAIEGIASVEEEPSFTQSA
jgi:hypothetical protein